MKINWSKLGFILTRERLLASGAIFIISGLLFLYGYATREKVEADDDFVVIKGTVKDFNFIDGQRGTRIYSFRVAEYNKTFRLTADFLKYFDKDNFKTVASTGEMLRIELPKSQGSLSRLNDGRTAVVFGLYSENQVLLDKQKTIGSHNSHFMVYSSMAFLVLGSIVVYYGFKAKREFGKEDNNC